MRQTKFHIDDFFEYYGSVYMVTGIEFGICDYLYKVKFISGDKENRKSAIGSAGEGLMTGVDFSKISLHTPDSAKDKELKNLIRLVLKYHAENLARDFHTESEEEFIYRKIKERDEV